ncbi:MAG: hypothetical protein LUG12_08615 [Erysipelotrichaceae bacterium]|nr:hypothetical protein [Erysipelotrichaceae bacterium]
MNSYISHIHIPSNKHLIITGRNASGKTILLDALYDYLEGNRNDEVNYHDQSCRY